MYLSQEIGSAKLTEIAQFFGLRSVGSIPTTIKKLKDLLEEDKSLSKIIDKMISEYDTCPF